MLDEKSRDRLLKITESVVGNCAIKDAKHILPPYDNVFCKIICQGLFGGYTNEGKLRNDCQEDRIK